MAFRNQITHLSQLIADKVIGAFIATAEEGLRIELDPTPGQPTIRMYTGHADEEVEGKLSYVDLLSKPVMQLLAGAYNAAPIEIPGITLTGADATNSVWPRISLNAHKLVTQNSGQINGVSKAAGLVARVGADIVTSNLVLTGVEQARLEAQINAQNDNWYVAVGIVAPDSDTAGHFTVVRLRHSGTSGGVGGTLDQAKNMDHRIANRSEAFMILGAFQWLGADDTTQYVKLTLEASSAGGDTASATAPNLLFVFEMS